jgi:nitroreductase
MSLSEASSTAPRQSMFDEVVRLRRATRAFLPRPVPRHLVEEILEISRHAPSNSNTQPWFVDVLAGDAQSTFSAAVLESHVQDALPPSQHFPSDFPDACKLRRSDFGARYYAALGIQQSDAEARDRQTARNFAFFGAPVGIVVTTDRRLTKFSWLDCGLFLQTLMLAAAARGLNTCPQVSFARHEPVIRELLRLPEERSLVVGMSLGYADTQTSVNQIDFPREPVDAFAKFHGFD